jgi:hypothetical protein
MFAVVLILSSTRSEDSGANSRLLSYKDSIAIPISMPNPRYIEIEIAIGIGIEKTMLGAVA